MSLAENCKKAKENHYCWKLLLVQKPKLSALPWQGALPNFCFKVYDKNKNQNFQGRESHTERENDKLNSRFWLCSGFSQCVTKKILWNKREMQYYIMITNRSIRRLDLLTLFRSTKLYTVHTLMGSVKREKLELYQAYGIGREVGEYMLENAVENTLWL